VQSEVKHSSDIYEPALVLASLCVYADKHKVYAVVVDGVGFGKCRPDVSEIFLMTTIEHLCVTFLSLIQFPLHRNKSFIYEAIYIVKF
jgi:hypothetical protein